MQFGNTCHKGATHMIFIPQSPEPDPTRPWQVAEARWRVSNADLRIGRIAALAIITAIAALAAVTIALIVSSSG
jgi:hypothetical protein